MALTWRNKGPLLLPCYPYDTDVPGCALGSFCVEYKKFILYEIRMCAPWKEAHELVLNSSYSREKWTAVFFLKLRGLVGIT